jgi:small-conductance mechanosensitive channel
MNGGVNALLVPASHDGLIAAAILAGVVVIGLIVQRVLFAVLLRIAERRHEGMFAALVRRAEAPATFAIPLFAASIALPDLKFPPGLDRLLLRAAAVATIVATAWGIVALIGLYTDLVKLRYRVDVEDNLRARQVETRIDILARSAVTIVVILAAALAAMTFPSIRTVGTTLLASAGAAGIIVGLAARPLFENLVAGVQIALTQPIRIDDVVIVEGQFGRIEAIEATYVVVRIWDQRRMVLPLTYFIEKPFENWTRTGAALIGEVFIFADFSVPVSAIREEVPKILAESKLWDGAVQNVQVTDATTSAVQIRILVSARNAQDLWDLRCEVREKIVAWLHQQLPASLPQTRFSGGPDGVSPTAQAAAAATTPPAAPPTT